VHKRTIGHNNKNTLSNKDTLIKQGHNNNLKMRNILDKTCRENQNMQSMLNFVFSENRTFYEVMWKNMVQLDMPQMKM
jgi:hypothetical protein